MDFRTVVELPTDLPPITHSGRILSLGSCFAEHTGQWLSTYKFCLDLNPFGVLYNPLSISAALREVMAGKVYTVGDLFFDKESWHSPMHHSSFSAPTPDEALSVINRRIRQAHEEIHRLEWLFISLGTAYVYEQRETGRVVGNCHKLPEHRFLRRRLSVDEVVADYVSLIGELTERNPNLKILFAVSPIRHARDGMHSNQLSKSTLLLAIDQLRKQFPQQAFYFPSYEIVLDELRDYRFYSDDMLHPSPLAVAYIWERLAKTLFDAETLRVIDAVSDIQKELAHRPFHPQSESYKRFLEQIVLKIERLNGKYPYLDFQKETELCRIRLNS